MFPTADGNIVLMCILPKFWEALARIVGHPELPDDPRFKGFDERFANRDALAAILDAALMKKTTAEWMALMAGQVPAAPVLTIAQALDNPYYAATGGVQAFDHPLRPGFRVVSSPLRLDGARPVAEPAPMLGADTDAVLAGAGFGAGEIADLRARGIVGPRG
jgi:crotonobetainyl-CoA:carnitine CoA-transferase CaiB-like acyl-CoA transferase